MGEAANGAPPLTPQLRKGGLKTKAAQLQPRFTSMAFKRLIFGTDAVERCPEPSKILTRPDVLNPRSQVFQRNGHSWSSEH